MLCLAMCPGFPITRLLFADFGRGVEDVVFSTSFQLGYLERQANGSLVDATTAHMSTVNVRIGGTVYLGRCCLYHNTTYQAPWAGCSSP